MKPPVLNPLKKAAPRLFARLMLGIALSSTAPAAMAGAVVVAKDSPLAAVDLEQAKKIFLGREPSIDGLTIVVVYQGESPTRADFEKKVLGKTGADLSAYWSKLIFTGKASAPLEAGSDAGVKATVNKTPGAVGYIRDEDVDGSVKVLLKY